MRRFSMFSNAPIENPSVYINGETVFFLENSHFYGLVLVYTYKELLQTEMWFIHIHDKV